MGFCLQRLNELLGYWSSQRLRSWIWRQTKQTQSLLGRRISAVWSRPMSYQSRSLSCYGCKCCKLDIKNYFSFTFLIILIKALRLIGLIHSTPLLTCPLHVLSLYALPSWRLVTCKGLYPFHSPPAFAVTFSIYQRASQRPAKLGPQPQWSRNFHLQKNHDPACRRHRFEPIMMSFEARQRFGWLAWVILRAWALATVAVWHSEGQHAVYGVVDCICWLAFEC